MNRQRASLFARSILALAVAFQLGSVYFGYQVRAYEPPGSFPHLDRVLLFLPALVVSAVIGALVAWRHPQHPVGWLFLAIGTLGYADGFAEGAGRYILVTQASTLPAGFLMLWLGLLLYTFDPILIAIALLLFPDGRLPSPRWRVVLCLLSLILRFRRSRGIERQQLKWFAYGASLYNEGA